MSYLFDVNVLIAMHDVDHQSHASVHEFFQRQSRIDWATCPLTEAGFIRIVSSPAYPSLDVLPSDAADILAKTVRSFGHHRYWGTTPSLLDESLFNLQVLRGNKQVTDTYLLGICAKHKGLLLTFDHKLNQQAIRNTAKLIELL
jgi:uncharacterized protein